MLRTLNCRHHCRQTGLFYAALYSENFTRFFIPPVAPLLQRPVKFYGSRMRAIVNTTAAVPALVRMQDNWRVPFFRMGNKYINLAYIDTVVATLACIRVKNNRRIGCNNILQGIFILDFHHRASLLILPSRHPGSLYCKLRNFLQDHHSNQRAVFSFLLYRPPA